MNNEAQSEQRLRQNVGNLYQQATKAVSDQEKNLQAQEGQVRQQEEAFVKSLLAEDAKIRQQLQQQLKDLQGRYGQEVSDLKTQADKAIQAQPQQAGVILAWTAQQYQNLTAGVTRQYQDVLNQFAFIDRVEQARFTASLAQAQEQFKALKQAEQNLLNAYANYQVALVDFYTQQVLALRTTLANQLNALQSSFNGYTQLAVPGASSFGYGTTSGSGSSGGHIFYDESQPKRH